jgi:hypothetical protein
MFTKLLIDPILFKRLFVTCFSKILVPCTEKNYCNTSVALARIGVGAAGFLLLEPEPYQTVHLKKKFHYKSQ